MTIDPSRIHFLKDVEDKGLFKRFFLSFTLSCFSRFSQHVRFFLGLSPPSSIELVTFHSPKAHKVLKKQSNGTELCQMTSVQRTKLMKGGRGSTVEIQANNKTDWKADLETKQEAKSMHATEEEGLS